MVVTDKSEANVLRTDEQTKELEGGRNVDIQKSMAESLEIFNAIEVKQLHKTAILAESAISHDCDGNSAVDFLDRLQRNSDHLWESSKQVVLYICLFSFYTLKIFH